MKKILFSFIAILFSIAIYSQTIIPGGPISGTWTMGGEPYLIEGETTIENGTTLTIEAGVHVIWQNDSSTMWVQGQIIALGGPDTDSIIFTAADTATGWKSIRFIDTPAANDSSKFKYCVFEYGRAYGPFPDNHGGAIAVLGFSKIRIDHCTFRNNKSIDNSIDPNPTGGAIVLSYSSALILNSSFINNESAAGAAIQCTDSSLPRIQNNEFAYNTAIEYGYWGTGYGGAISIYLNSDPDIINNTFHDNYAGNGGGAISVVDTCDPLIERNLIYGNTSGWGGGIEIQSGCSPTIINNTIAHNNAGLGGGIDFWGQNIAEVRNNILWGNTASTEGDQVYIWDDGDNLDFFYCDIEGSDTAFGGVPHTGEYKNCIDSIPLFVDHLTGDYHLMLGSPCIDAGDPASPLDPDGTISDMGALFFDQTGIGISDIRYQKSEVRIGCWPNPTSGKSDIRYQISEVRNVTITVHDVTGKQVMLLADEMQNAGEHVINIDISELPDGLYVIRLQAGNESAVGKVLVVR